MHGNHEKHDSPLLKKIENVNNARKIKCNYVVLFVISHDWLILFDSNLN